MSITDLKRIAKYAWKHKHIVYSYFLLRLAMISPFTGFNAFLHRLRGVVIKKKVRIGRGVLLDPLEPGSIVLEDLVSLAPGVIVYAHTNPTLALYEYMGPRTVNTVQIKQGSRIGAGAVILPGVTIGRYCVIAAHTVVTRDVPDHTRVAGIPARPENNDDKEDEDKK